MHIVETAPQQLREVLSKYKSEDYTVIGIEQTSTSFILGRWGVERWQEAAEESSVRAWSGEDGHSG